MATEEKTTGRVTIATVVATAAVTLAVGVTAAALGGYLAPARDHDQAAVAQASEPPVAEAPAVPRTVAPNVVLVPVAPDTRALPATVPAPPEPEVLVAAYDPVEYGHDDDDDDHDDHRRGRRHHEDDHDDD